MGNYLILMPRYFLLLYCTSMFTFYSSRPSVRLWRGRGGGGGARCWPWCCRHWRGGRRVRRRSGGRRRREASHLNAVLEPNSLLIQFFSMQDWRGLLGKAGTSLFWDFFCIFQENLPLSDTWQYSAQDCLHNLVFHGFNWAKAKEQSKGNCQNFS